MRRPSSIEPFTPSPTVTLHPVLQAVLDSLDVQVDEELMRYRRQRRRPGGTNAVPPRLPQSRPLDATAIGILDSSIARSAPRASIYDAAPSSSGAPQCIAPPAAPPAVEQHRPSPHWLEEPPADTPPISPDWASAPTQLSSAGEASEATPDSMGITSYGDLADLSAYTPSATLQKLMQQAGMAEPEGPVDYLASSEELLRSIAEEDPVLRTEPEPNALLNTLLTPLGIGSMLLLLLSSTTLGYVMMNPATIGWITQPKPSPSAASSAGSASTTSQSSAPSPDLSSEEFVDLDLDTLSTLPRNSALGGNSTAKPKATSSGAAKPAERSATGATATNRTAAASTSSRPTAIPEVPLPQPGLSTVVVPADPPPVVSVPEAAIEPAPAPVSPEPIETAPPVVESAPAPPAVSSSNIPETAAPVPSRSAPAQAPNYYVVTEYSGDASLETARQAVPDAYVRNLPAEGAKVQLGAFSDEAKAQEMLQQLRNQGIEAEVYQPQ